jgi:hypothetical protein
MLDYSMLRTEKEIEDSIALFKSPTLCRSNFSTYKINWNGEDIFFGVINNKLAVFSTYLDEKGKVQMKLYGCRNITSEESKDKDYIKRKANHALTNLIENNKKNYLPLRRLKFSDVTNYLQAA